MRTFTTLFNKMVNCIATWYAMPRYLVKLMELGTILGRRELFILFASEGKVAKEKTFVRKDLHDKLMFSPISIPDRLLNQFFSNFCICIDAIVRRNFSMS